MALPAPWLDTQKGEVAEKATPHGFFKFGSVVDANPGTSDTRLIWLKVSAPKAFEHTAKVSVNTIFRSKWFRNIERNPFAAIRKQTVPLTETLISVLKKSDPVSINLDDDRKKIVKNSFICTSAN